MSLAYGKTQLEPKFLEATLLIEINFNHKQNYYLGTQWFFGQNLQIEYLFKK
jgi:hypothetical protein